MQIQNPIGERRLVCALSSLRGRSKLVLESSSFPNGGPIPVEHSDSEGRNVSPGLRWSGVPEGTQELMLICEDPDALKPSPVVHWVMYRIPPTLEELPVGIGTKDAPGGALQGENSVGRSEYRGPHPPRGHGTHHYHFELFALDRPLGLDVGATREEVVQAAEGHVLATGDYVGTYERK